VQDFPCSEEGMQQAAAWLDRQMKERETR